MEILQQKREYAKINLVPNKNFLKKFVGWFSFLQSMYEVLRCNQ